MMLSLPIPQNEIESGLYYFMFYDHAKCPLKSHYYLKKSQNMIDLRKQIAEQMGVDPWSFILCMIETKDLQRMLCRNRTIAELADDTGCLFAFQIDPALFENERDPDAYKKLMKLLDHNDVAIDMSNDDDFNNSINRDWVKVPIRLTMMEKTTYSYYARKKPQSFPRVMWINRNWDLITVHKQVFNFLRYYFDFELESFQALSEEEAFMSIFEDLTEQNWKDKLGAGEDPGEYAYSLMIVNPEKKSYYSKGVEFFGFNNYENIPLPFEQNTKFGDLIDKYFLEYENKNESSDDDMDYGAGKKDEEEKEKTIKVHNNMNDGYYAETSHHKYSDKRRIFEFEIFFNKDRKQAALHKLDRCKKHEKFSEIEMKAQQTTSEKITLDQCFDSFSKPEMLGKDNAWYCRICKDHVEAMKKLELYSCPPILFISLKRFKSGRGSYFKDKLEDEVLFPIDHLDISNIVLSNKDENGNSKGSIVYELYAISNHYGNMGFGHYTAFAKNPLDNTWYDFDDSHVTEISDPSKVVTEAAYNLFYKRKNFSFTDEIDFEAIKNTCEFEDFKMEVSHYSIPEDKKEEAQKNDEDMAASKPDDM